MRSGKLDRTITIQRYTSGVDDYGTPVMAWTDLANLRAQIVQASTDEFIRNGAVDETVIIFRTRYLAGVTNADRISYGDGVLNLKEVKEIGRRQGLELRCTRLA
ncbi:phage head closure protein [Agrobacterium rhizogenes]|nr:phage head closure protein [Rhizobium rhizogenes]NTH70518.1 phage head closure protein [Rhizobium rhizogenes]NTJ00286.1 phage head closure protein [Rhizobium rhizogenes]